MITLESHEDKSLSIYQNDKCIGQSSSFQNLIIPIATSVIALLSLFTLNRFYFSHQLDFSRLFNSDTLFLPSLYRDFRQGIFSFNDFYFSGAIFFFPDWFMYAISRFLGGSTYLAIPIYFTLQMMILCGLTFAITRFFFRSGPLPYLMAASICVFLVEIDIKSPSQESFEWPYSISMLSVTHFGEFLSWLASTYLVLKILFLQNSTPSPRTRYVHWALVVLILLTTFSDRLFLVNWTIPVFLCLYVFKKLGVIRLGLFLLLSLEFFSGTLFGYTIIPKILGLHSGFYENGIHIGNVSNNGKVLIDIVSDFFSRHRNISFFLIVLYSACIVGIVRLRKKGLGRLQQGDPDSPVHFLCVFLLLLVPIMISAMYLSGDFGLSNYAEIRYMIPIFLGPIVFAPILLKEFGLSLQSPLFKLAFLGTLLFGFSIILSETPKNLAEYSSFYPDDVRCVDNVLAHLGAHRGISPYWQARYITMLSQKNTQVVAVNPNATPYLWISNRKWYSGKFDFAVLPEGDKSLIRSFQNSLGKPKETFNCSGMSILFFGIGGISLK